MRRAVNLSVASLRGLFHYLAVPRRLRRCHAKCPLLGAHLVYSLAKSSMSQFGSVEHSLPWVVSKYRGGSASSIGRCK